MKNYLTTICLTVTTILFLDIAGLAQVSINGPACVTTGIEYLYAIKGDNDTSQNKKVCVTGGEAESSGSGCVEGKRLKFIKISWDSSAVLGVITYSSPTGSTTLNVNIVQQLSGGSIATNSISQGSDSASIPVTIHCAAATGGSCKTNYVYQWEQSTDNISWAILNGANAKDLVFHAPIRKTTYYRRKVKTADSDTIVYTNAAIVVINPSANPQ